MEFLVKEFMFSIGEEGILKFWNFMPLSDFLKSLGVLLVELSEEPDRILKTGDPETVG